MRLSFRSPAFALLAFALCGALAACAPTIANRGTMVEPEKLAQVRVGETSREGVIELLGSPSQVGAFDETVWYYVGRSTKQYSFLDPEIVTQTAVEIRFSPEGTVSGVQSFDPALAQDVATVSRKTPTYGHETTFVEQLVGNLGRPAGLAGKESKR